MESREVQPLHSVLFVIGQIEHRFLRFVQLEVAMGVVLEANNFLLQQGVPPNKVAPVLFTPREREL